MRHPLVAGIPLLVLSCLLMLGTAARAGGPGAAESERLLRADASRITAHLMAVEEELLTRDVSHLFLEQRAARARHIAVLRDYRQAGIFPHNHDVPGARVPVFVDRHGTHCAVGYLLAQAGRSDIVNRVRQTRNLARVPELADDPALVAWLDSTGISLEEAARIQPTYGGGGVVAEDDGEVSAGYALASALSLGFGGVSIARSIGPAPSRIDGVYGLLIGAYGMALGIPRIDDGGAAQALGVLNTAVGATAAALGTRTLWRSGSDARAEAAEEVPSVAVAAGPAVAPMGAGMQLTFHVRF